MKLTPCAISETITKRHGRSFYLASRILGRKDRHRAYDLYALCRIIDDATDEFQPSAGIHGDVQTAQPHELAGAALSLEILSELYHQCHSEAFHPFHEKPQALHALVNTINRCLGRHEEDSLGILGPRETQIYMHHIRDMLLDSGITKSHLEALIEGQRSDEAFTQPLNFKEFYIYCFQVAGVVGLMMALIFKARQSSEILKAAEHLGIAMQITNILRDIKEDALLRQRIYIPADLLQQNALTSADLVGATRRHEKKNELVTTLGQIGLAYYQNALLGINGIPAWRCRLCVRLMAAIYGAILASILQSPSSVFEGRVVIGKMKRLWIAVQVLMGIPPLLAAGFSREVLGQSSSTWISTQDLNKTLG